MLDLRFVRYQLYASTTTTSHNKIVVLNVMVLDKKEATVKFLSSYTLFTWRTVHSYIAYILKHGINVLEKEHVRVCNDVAADLVMLVVVLVYVKNQKKQKEVPPKFLLQ